MKSRARDPSDLTYGGLQIVDPNNGGLVAGWGNANRGYALDLDEVENWTEENSKKDSEKTSKIHGHDQTGGVLRELIRLIELDPEIFAREIEQVLSPEELESLRLAFPSELQNVPDLRLIQIARTIIRLVFDELAQRHTAD